MSTEEGVFVVPETGWYQFGDGPPRLLTHAEAERMTVAIALREGDWTGFASVPPCQAAVPVTLTGHLDSPMFGPHTVVVEPAWAECGQPAVATHEYRCAHDASHTKRRATCPEHQPQPGAVGCRDCWEQGTERPMTFERVT